MWPGANCRAAILAAVLCGSAVKITALQTQSPSLTKLPDNAWRDDLPGPKYWDKTELVPPEHARAASVGEVI